MGKMYKIQYELISPLTAMKKLIINGKQSFFFIYLTVASSQAFDFLPELVSS